jgi:hypothetical protein
MRLVMGRQPVEVEAIIDHRRQIIPPLKIKKMPL